VFSCPKKAMERTEQVRFCHEHCKQWYCLCLRRRSDSVRAPASIYWPVVMHVERRDSLHSVWYFRNIPNSSPQCRVKLITHWHGLLTMNIIWQCNLHRRRDVPEYSTKRFNCYEKRREEKIWMRLVNLIFAAVGIRPTGSSVKFVLVFV
jgi:hypothetical protein